MCSRDCELSVFQAALAQDIRSNPEYRAEFASMCTAIGVDPLASSSERKGGANNISDDVTRAVKTLGPLGPGFSFIEIDEKQWVRSVPKELNMDQSMVLEAMQILEYSSNDFDDLVSGSLVWMDMQTGETEY
ncbi:hypothetical protein BDZ91DRAFT_776543 [Kalaharituber pfeilii]|nr:hypothetical protein BDZ91DRAFT_776543 [Kalaharituber pfeilii]